MLPGRDFSLLLLSMLKSLLEHLVLILERFHPTSHLLDELLEFSHLFLQSISLKLLLIQLAFGGQDLFLCIAILLLEEGDDLVLLLLAAFLGLRGLDRVSIRDGLL